MLQVCYMNIPKFLEFMFNCIMKGINVMDDNLINMLLWVDNYTLECLLIRR